MINDKILYSLDDVMIQPAAVTTIRHREDIKSVYEDGYLPIFTAPMPCVVNTNQYLTYTKARINPIIPRTETLETRLMFLEKYDMFVAFSLDEFISLFLMNHYDIDKVGRPIKVLIDIACGSMDALHNAIRSTKGMYKDKMIIMSGNVANPDAFYQLAKAGCDLVRCSVGSGSGCFHPDTLVTTTNGKKPIKQIKPGDYVLTHTNVFKKVTNLIPQKEDSQLVVINNKLKCTKQHKLFVINKDDKEKVTEDNYLEFAYWLEAEKLDKSKHLLINLVSEPT